MNSVALRNVSRALQVSQAKTWTPIVTQKASFQNIPPPRQYKDVEFPERTRLRVTMRVPEFPSNTRAPKSQKKLCYMRGPEEVHNTLLHKQYGIIALTGGRMKVGHFEMVRMAIVRKMDKNRMFAIWRVEHPWQPLTRKGVGHKMGGGKGPIQEYVTPLKRDQVIIEVGGRCDFDEVKRFLTMIAERLPFKAIAVSQDMMDARKENIAIAEKLNTNKWNLEYIMKNNMGTSRSWMRRVDFFHFGKYI